MQVLRAVIISLIFAAGQATAETNCHCGGIVTELGGAIFAEDPLVESEWDYHSAVNAALDIAAHPDGGCDVMNSFPDDQETVPVYTEANGLQYKKLRWINTDGSTEWLTMTETSDKALALCQNQQQAVKPVS